MAQKEKNIVLKIENLEVGYSHSKANISIAKGIYFDIKKGELVSLVGANGVGKSTLLRTLSGMQNALSGNIFYNGKKLNSFSAIQLAQQLSVVLTESPASQNLSVLELISLGRQPYTNWIGTLSSEDKKAIKFAIESTEITSLKYMKCYELSDGQLQRVLIARAIAQDTPIIILDEPTTHLDIYHRAYILKLLKNLTRQTNKTILFSTHEIDHAIQVSDKMIVMTSQETYFETPEILIKSNKFDSLFPTDTVEFDAEAGQFKIR